MCELVDMVEGEAGNSSPIPACRCVLIAISTWGGGRADDGVERSPDRD